MAQIDLLVLDSQRWLNITYGGVDGFGWVEENGLTGWPTMYGLIRALQHELGITALSDNFGPGTMSRLEALGPISPATQNKNIVKIVQCALWCKGYNGGFIVGEGEYTDRVSESVQELRADIGIVPGGGSVTVKIFKALLTMNAYVLVPGGDPAVRQVQQWLNSKYWNRQDFYYIPADGYFSRDVQTALMFGIQYEIGMADGVANGNFGPGTQNGLRTQALLSLGAADGAKSFVRLFQAAMRFNRQAVPFDGIYGQATFTAVSQFQDFAKLAPYDGRANYQTWASLLVSTGDPNRPVTAADCMMPLNAARASALKSAGYSTVGRYLTGGANKRLTAGELQTIFKAGIAVFPIYQVWNNELKWFDYIQGAQAGRAAYIAAREFGFAPFTTIYFAVDYDAQDHEIYSHILPYFQGVAEAFEQVGSEYRVGVYGSRNICSTISEEGFAHGSFVSGMSTGFSGNLGFPLPVNWAFDQIANTIIGAGTPGELEIDRNAKSGRDQGQASVNPPAGVNNGFFTYVDWLRRKAGDWRKANPSNDDPDMLVLQYLRRNPYSGPPWNGVAGNLNQAFMDFVDADTSQPRVETFQDPATGIKMTANHLAYAVTTHWRHAYPPADAATFADAGAWAGDLVTCLGDYKRNNYGYASALEFGLEFIGQEGGIGTFGEGDLYEDIDGFNLAYRVLDPDDPRNIAQIIRDYYTGTGTAKRFTSYYMARFEGSSSNLSAAATTAVQGSPLQPDYWLFAIGLLAYKYQLNLQDIPVQDKVGMALAYATKILDRVAKE